MSSNAGDGCSVQPITFVSSAIYLESVRVAQYSAVTLSDSGLEFSVTTENDPRTWKDAAGAVGPLLVRVPPSDICRVMAYLPLLDGSDIFVALTRKGFNTLSRHLAVSVKEAPPQSCTTGDSDDDGDPSNRILSLFTSATFGRLQSLLLRNALPPGAFCEIGAVAARRIAVAKGISPLRCAQATSPEEAFMSVRDVT